VLCAIELHDELFWIWHNGGDDIRPVLMRVPDIELYFRFFELDATTEGKDPSLLWWVRHAIAQSGRWMPAPLVPEHPAESGSDVTYIETFATVPGEQKAVALAARDPGGRAPAHLGGNHEGAIVFAVHRGREASRRGTSRAGARHRTGAGRPTRGGRCAEAPAGRAPGRSSWRLKVASRL
jgi:hypothetical protein